MIHYAICVPVLSPFSHFLTLGFSRAFLLYRLVRFSVPFHFFPFAAFSDFRIFGFSLIFHAFRPCRFSNFRPFANFSDFSSFQISNFRVRSFFTLIVFSYFRIFGLSLIFHIFHLFRFSNFRVFAHFSPFSFFPLFEFSGWLSFHTFRLFSFSNFPVLAHFSPFSSFPIFEVSDLRFLFVLFSFLPFRIFADSLYHYSFSLPVFEFSRFRMKPSPRWCLFFGFSRFLVRPARSASFLFLRFRVFGSSLHQSPEQEDT